MFNKFIKQLPAYSMVTWDKWAFYSCLNDSPVIHRQSNIDHLLYSRLIITADTETSKGKNTEDNHIVIWSITIAFRDIKIVTLYGRKPSDFVKCLTKIKDNIPCNKMYVFFHNLGYDWVFLRRYLLKGYDKPDYQLNLKPHSPLLIEFNNGIIFRDTLALGQRRLAKWAEDLNCEHQKMVGDWDYNKIRHQSSRLTKRELGYMEADTLVLAECIQKTIELLKCNITSLPYTATGIPRRDIRKIGKKNKAKIRYNNCLMDYDDYIFAEAVYHGGYSHANRFYVGELLTDTVQAYDFSSSYPAVLISEKYPCEQFMPIDITAEEIIQLMDDYAFMFNLVLVDPVLKTGQPMPALQLSKCTTALNPLIDNGRVIEAKYIKIPISEQDLYIILQQYDYTNLYITDCRAAAKDYLPRWLTDYIYQLYYDKCTLKTGDPVLYDIQKAKLNSIYGMHVQKCIRYDNVEDYDTGEYYIDEEPDPKELYRKYVKKWGVILPYQWGVWCTAYAFKNLFTLGSCAGTWLYSDTDSCYGINWDTEAVAQYNDNALQKLKARGYDPITIDGKTYVLGAASLDGTYKEFITQGAKRYACRTLDDQIKITVAGVPKKTGAACLNNDLHNFIPGMIFDGETTGKLQHTYIFVEKPYINEYGDEVADSIDLNPCDYKLDTAQIDNFDDLFIDEQEGLPIYG